MMPESLKTTIIEIGRLFAIGVVIGLATWLQTLGISTRIDEAETSVKQRVKASENLVQETVKEETAAVVEEAAKVAEVVAAEAAEEEEQLP
jgi:cell division protein FtsX